MKLAELAARAGARLIGDGDVEVFSVGSVERARRDQITVAISADERRAISGTAAGAVIVDEAFAADRAHEFDCAFVVSSSPAVVLRDVIDLLHPPEPQRAQPFDADVHPSAVVDCVFGQNTTVGANAVVGRAHVGANVSIGAGCVVGDDVVVGAFTVLHAGVVLQPGVKIGQSCVIGPGCVIGDEGFVFVPDLESNAPVRHLASVVLSDEVHLGAQVCVDRGFLRDTEIGARTRVDNLVQIAHDVVIGKDCVITAQVGIAGYATLGDGVVIAGQAGVGPHVRVADRVRVGGQAGVTHDINDVGAAVSGTPAFEHLAWLQGQARIKSLARLEARVRALETQLKRLPPPPDAPPVAPPEEKKT